MLLRRRIHPPALLALAVVGALSIGSLVGCAPESSTSTTPSVTEPTETPTQPPPPTPEELRHAKAVAIVDALSTRERVGSVIVSSIPGTDPAVLGELMRSCGLGGFLLMGSNIPGTPDELRQLVASLTVDPALPPLVSIDEEGGIVKRLPWDELPGADMLRSAPAEETSAAFRARAELLASAGVNVNFGIVADVTSDPRHFIYLRSLGDDPQTAAARVSAAVAGEHGLVASTLKHFPGHGATSGDSHVSIPSTDMPLEAWKARDAIPFTAGIAAGAELLMFGHLAYTAMSPLPASLSPEWYAYARDRLGFTGVAITDDLGMLQGSGLPEYQDPVANTVAALGAGADLAIVMSGMDAPGIEALVAGVTAATESGSLDAKRLRDAAVRVVDLRLKLAGE